MWIGLLARQCGGGENERIECPLSLFKESSLLRSRLLALSMEEERGGN